MKDEYDSNLLGLCDGCYFDRIECRNLGYCQADKGIPRKEQEQNTFDIAVEEGDCYDCEFDPTDCQYTGICKLRSLL